jgi:hypothetical protein
MLKGNRIFILKIGYNSTVINKSRDHIMSIA